MSTFEYESQPPGTYLLIVVSMGRGDSELYVGSKYKGVGHKKENSRELQPPWLGGHVSCLDGDVSTLWLFVQFAPIGTHVVMNLATLLKSDMGGHVSTMWWFVQFASIGTLCGDVTLTKKSGVFILHNLMLQVLQRAAYDSEL